MTRQIALRSWHSVKLLVGLVACGVVLGASGCANPTEYDITGEDGGTGSGNGPGLGGASSAGARPMAGASSAGAGNSSSAGSGGQGAAGAAGSGGSSTAGAPSAGSSSGGNGAAGSASGGSAGQGSAGGSSAGGSSAGGSSAGSTGGTGCSAPAWVNGTSYKIGDVVTATCNAPGGGAAVCTSGKKYVWTCMGAGCTAFGAGTEAWWANWTLGTTCN